MRPVSFFLFAAIAALVWVTPAKADIVVSSNAVEDSQYINGAADRFEQLLGFNRSRFGAVRFDTSVIAPFVGSNYELLSAKLVLTEESNRDSTLNQTQTATVGAFFMRTDVNSGWTAPATYAWHGNTNARPGDFGGAGGDNNVDGRSTSDPIEAAGNSFNAGVNQQSMTFVTGVLDVVEIDLTEAGGSLSDIKLLMEDWVSGSNAGLGLTAESTGQITFRSVGTASGTEGGSGTGLAGALANGSALTGVGGVARLELDFQFVGVPEPSSLLVLGGIGIVGLIRRRK